jgi:flagellum-specific peptidoglycan hydrolase FlgJ
MTESEQKYLAATVPAAIATMREYGVPASVTLAQSILESSNDLGWGCSILATAYNNYFGIKAASTIDPETYVALPTEEYVNGKEVKTTADFARYPSPQGSFEAHARLLSLAARYKPAMAVKTNPELFATELQRCGYSTSPIYAQTLVKLIQEFDLTQYDLPPTLAAFVLSPAAPAPPQQAPAAPAIPQPQK